MFFLLFAMALDGTWEKPCEQQVLRREIFQGNRVSLVERNFSDTNCESPVIESVSEGEFAVGGKIEISPEGNEMDFYFSRVLMRPLEAETAKWMNQNSFCGIAHWQLGVLQEITGRTCRFSFGEIRVPDAGEQRFGIFRLEGNRLFFGRLDPDKNGKNRESRPNRWDETPFRKISNP